MAGGRDFTTDGMVIREIAVGEHDKIITLLTPERGSLSVMVKGARSLRNRMLAPSRLFSYGNYEIHAKGDMGWLRDATVSESFNALENDITSLYLAQYLCDVACELSGENEPGRDILRLLLNSCHAICSGKYDQRLIKGVFELRAAGMSGYMPDLHACIFCRDGRGKSPAYYLDIMNGAIICSDCLAGKNIRNDEDKPPEEVPHDEYDGTRRIVVPMSYGVLSAVRYALTAESKRMLAFNISNEKDMNDFSTVAEKYLVHHLERSFDSLKLYNSIRC